MLTLEPRTHAESPERPPRRGRPVAAAAVIVIAAVGAVALLRDQPEAVDPAVPVVTADVDVPPPSTREEDAAATALEFYGAVNTGDVDAMIAMSNADFTDVDADRQMWEMIAVTTSIGEPWTIGACEPTSVDSLSVEVGCTVVINDPVWQTLGVSELVAPVRVFDDATVQWLPFQGADFSIANQASADYLKTFRAAEYEAVCDPVGYELGTINFDGGLALTKPCAELFVPLAGDAAQWITDGRPQA
jgi:hypothetical protein